jgi:uncharacterized protein (TIGR03435 family)
VSKFIVLAVAASAFAGRAHAQAAFDVASIKRAAISVAREGGNRARIEHTPNSLSMFNVGLSDCVQWAYGVASFQVSGRVGTDSYDILAKTEAPVTVSQLRTMLQNLLAARFKLALHRESRMFPVYELVVARGGPRLPAAKGGQPLVRAAESLPRIENDSFVFADVSMAEFGRMLSQLRGIELPVIDRTGIPGSFDLTLKSAPSAAREADRGGLFALIQEQLGLRLIPAKAPFEVLIIDHAERPEVN